jgi:hypothetical protein
MVRLRFGPVIARLDHVDDQPTCLGRRARAEPMATAVAAAELLTVEAFAPESNCHPSYEPCIPTAHGT